MSKQKLLAHIVVLPRFFAAPFFGCAMLIGVILAGGSIAASSTLLAFICCMFLMAASHSANTLLDYSWTGLDKGEQRSVTKSYTGGCGVIAEGILTEKEVMVNSIGWFVLALIPGLLLVSTVTPYLIIPILLAPAVAVWYSWSKFNYTHELALASGVVVAVLLGAMSTGTGNYLKPMLVAIPISMIFSFGGLALDEWPDAKANLKKGVKSIAYKVYDYKIDLGTYLMIWFAYAYIFQTLLISIGILKSQTAITFVLVPVLIGCCVFLKSKVEFAKVAKAIVIAAACYPLLLLIGEVVG